MKTKYAAIFMRGNRDGDMGCLQLTAAAARRKAQKRVAEYKLLTGKTVKFRMVKLIPIK